MLTCATCQFFALEEDGSEVRGDCRRHAPLVTGGMMSSVETVWPQVGETQWCGDHEADFDEVEDEAPTYKCAERKDGMHIGADWPTCVCPKCGNDCIPF